MSNIKENGKHENGDTLDYGSVSKSSHSEEDTEELIDTRCGYTTSCKPDCLQVCANPKVYLLIISLCSIIQGFAVNGINNVNISSYERRYLLTSKDSSLVASFYDVAAGLTVLFVGYFGGTGHQPRYLGCGVASIGLGCLVMSLAHFCAPPYEPKSGLSVNCDIYGASEDLCSDSSNNNAFLKNYLYVLLLGQSLNGFGGTCLYSLGVTYLDQSVSAKMSPLYIGLMAGSSILGPAVGYILGGSLLNIYVDFPNPPPEGLTPTDPSWVGAWWLGFIISAVLAVILSLFMFLFPKELPGTTEIRAAKISEAHDNGTEGKVNNAGFGLSVKDMPLAAWYLLKNPTYLCITAVVALEIAIAAGFSTFMPKFIANQFAQQTSWAAQLTGFIAIPGAALGQVMGGYFCKRFKLKLRGILKLVLISSCIVTCLTPLFWARCADVKMAGVLVNYPQAEGIHNTTSNSLASGLDDTCNAGCGCDTGLYDPVCADDIQYFSPCHAGCPSRPMEDVDGVLSYHNCSCPSGANPLSMIANTTVVMGGACDLDCSLLYVFIPFAFVMFFFTFFMGSPLTVATLRVVPEKQRAFGVGVQWVFLRFLGSIPGPIIFGTMIDASCTLWEDDCGTRGSCWVYDNKGMSMRLFILALVLKCLSIVFNVIAMFVYKPPKESEEGAENEPECDNLTSPTKEPGTEMISNSSTAQIMDNQEKSEVSSLLPNPHAGLPQE